MRLMWAPVPQWRAGINPGRTRLRRRQPRSRRGRRNGGPGLIPAERRRTKVAEAETELGRNGGPGLIPAEPDAGRRVRFVADTPQWRAGINPGRTTRSKGGNHQWHVGRNGGAGINPGRTHQRPGRSGRTHRRRNGGPGLIPAEPRSRHGCTPRTPGRNGGPGLIPAEPTAAPVKNDFLPRPQWRAGINPGRT